MQGTRLPDADMATPGLGWDAWMLGECAAGSYMRVTSTHGKGTTVMWFIRDPDGQIGTIVSNHHTVIEHEDGTITVQPSILARDYTAEELREMGVVSILPQGLKGWHGWLERGVWRSI